VVRSVAAVSARKMVFFILSSELAIPNPVAAPLFRFFPISVDAARRPLDVVALATGRRCRHRAPPADSSFR